MSDPLAELHNDVREMRQHVLDLLATVASTNTKVDLLNNRLYSDGAGGAIPTLYKQHAELQAKVHTVAQAVSNQHAWAIGYGAGAGGVLVLARHVAAKFGFNF